MEIPQQTSSPIAEEHLQFSNVIPESPYSALPSPHLSDKRTSSPAKKQRLGVKNPLVPTTSGGLPFVGFDSNVPPDPPGMSEKSGSPDSVADTLTERQWTGRSLFRAASSIRDFAVSHFKVPSIAAPWEHELSEKHGASVPSSDTIRYIDYRRQRRRLFINSTFQWFVTASICAILASCLYGFSTIVDGLSSTRKYVFNALVTGLSLWLGPILASSLRNYAQMMRWDSLPQDTAHSRTLSS